MVSLLLLLAYLQWPCAYPSAGGSRVWAAGAGKCNSIGLLSCNAQVGLLLQLLRRPPDLGVFAVAALQL